MSQRSHALIWAITLMSADIVWGAPILDASSSQISFQGRITDNGGIPIAGPTVDLEFRLYSGGGLLLGPGIVRNAVPVLPGGLVSVLIPFVPGDFDGSAREIGVSINGGPELVPRTPVGAVPYAYRVDRVTSAELDDYISLGAPGAGGGLTIYGPQATPTFFLDGNQNRLTLVSDDTSSSVILQAENGQGMVTASLSGQPRAVLDSGNGDVWARSTVNVGTLANPIANSVAYASLQFGPSFGGRMLAWDPGHELTTVVGSTAGSAGGGLVQLYRNGGGVTVEIVGDDGNGSGEGTWRDTDANTTLRLSGQDHRLYTYGAGDAEHARLGGATSGNLQLRAGGAANPLTVNVNASGGGAIDLLDSAGSDFGVRLSGGTSTTSGRIRVYDTGNTNTVDILGENGTTGGGLIAVRDGANDRVVVDADANRIQMFGPGAVETVRLFGNGAGGGGGVSLRNDAGMTTVTLDGDDENASDSGAVQVLRGDGTSVFELNADSRTLTGTGARALFQNDSGQTTVEVQGDESNSGVIRLRRANGNLGVLARATEGTGSELNLYNSSGTASIQLDTDWSGSGNSRVVTNELEITGGSDLSEQFEISELGGVAEAGSVVCIDPDRPGALMLCSEAYDTKVAGIISGAGGVKTGMYMGQSGTRADGAVPVALTGRVYCRVDASARAIQPGDLLTTSDRAGLAMKVADHDRAHGATIGKAMTGLDVGEGLVLVLVNLH